MLVTIYLCVAGWIAFAFLMYALESSRVINGTVLLVAALIGLAWPFWYLPILLGIVD